MSTAEYAYQVGNSANYLPNHRDIANASTTPAVKSERIRHHRRAVHHKRISIQLCGLVVIMAFLASICLNLTGRKVPTWSLGT